MSDPAATSPAAGPAVPAGKVALNLLFVNGQRKDGWIFDPEATLDSVTGRIMAEWPSDLTVEKPVAQAQIRLLLRGRFLEGPGSLAAHKLTPGEATVVHVVIKAHEPAAAAPADSPKPAAREVSPNKCCTIM
ncbi:hypothetical protein H9P43_001360 [Blastocladiella emersonii ATCC 22665]|nr:hypothetical protein H9P43_001360 [Blastocladiella emersonii ATCC 22665]